MEFLYHRKYMRLLRYCYWCWMKIPTSQLMRGRYIKPCWLAMTDDLTSPYYHLLQGVLVSGASSLRSPQHGGLFRKKDRKSTRLNSSHANISYAVFCLKKKKK